MEYKGKKFASKAELFDYLRANKAELIEMKKAEVKFTDPFGCDNLTLTKDGVTSKDYPNDNADKDTSDVIYRTIVGNTYYWLDSHSDVHVKNCFKKSIQERGVKRIAHLHDHRYSLEAKVGKFDDIYEKEISWRDLGVDIDGKTWALLGDSAIKRALNKNIFDQYKDGEIDQHSVGMWYVKLELALDDEDDDEHYKVWMTYIDQIANKEEAQKQGYFWVVKEAKLIEISAVIAGSNPITPTLPASTSNENKNADPAAASQDRSNKSNFYHLIH